MRCRPAKSDLGLSFVLSGEDARVGGGIYWRENERKSKNTCVNAPAIVSGLRLYEVTKRPEYLDHARRLYECIGFERIRGAATYVLAGNALVTLADTFQTIGNAIAI